MQLAGITQTGLSRAVPTHQGVLNAHPEVGTQPRVLIEIRFDHTKSYLGGKDAYNFCFLLFPEYASVADRRDSNEVYMLPCSLCFSQMKRSGSPA